MDATEILCSLLEERGVEWREHEAPAAECIAFFDGNGWHDCWESVGGEVNVTFSMTPEQAIAATLGRAQEGGRTSDATRTQLEPTRTTLRSCPFCGGKAEFRSGSSTTPYIRCRECGGRTKSSRNRANLIAAWNRRAED